MVFQNSDMWLSLLVVLSEGGLDVTQSRGKPVRAWYKSPPTLIL